jgi:ABC-type multidrug transport system ATPase subunit
MAEADSLCDRIAFLKAGQIETVGTPGDIKKRLAAGSLEEAFIELAKP